MACRCADGSSCTLPAMLHDIPSESAFPLFFPSTQASILSPADLIYFNEQRDNPVKLCPQVLCPSNPSLVGHASRASSPHCLFHLRSHLPQPSFFGKRYQRLRALAPNQRILDLKQPNDAPMSTRGPNLNWKKLPYDGPYKIEGPKHPTPLTIVPATSELFFLILTLLEPHGARACVAVDART
jgi:hypothetical protein